MVQSFGKGGPVRFGMWTPIRFPVLRRLTGQVGFRLFPVLETGEGGNHDKRETKAKMK